jgi:phage virion morphogenesis protein
VSDGLRSALESADLQAELQSWLDPLLARLQPAQLRRLARAVAAQLRACQSRRIAAQRNPDGSAFEPRRVPARAHARAAQARQPCRQRQEREHLRTMFAKLRTRAHMKAYASASEAGVQIEGRSARIARVHQLGLLDRAHAGAPEVRYPMRVLLGLSADDLTALIKHIRGHLSLGYE